MAIIIRPLTSLADMAEVEQLQKTVWETGDLEIVPVHALHAIQHNGGALIGALADGKIVGFVLGILGTRSGPEFRDASAAERLKMYSVMAGVLPACRGLDVGYRLKLAQREFALNLGLDLITWTYDPLESLNGRFNIGKLGATCHTYLRHHHGEMMGLNAGIPTDRFEVAWWINSDRVEARLANKQRSLSLETALELGAVLVNEVSFTSSGLPVPSQGIRPFTSDAILLEIPANFQQIKKMAFDLAVSWREHTRHLFEALFADGYGVMDFVIYRKGNGRQRSFYLLEKK